MKALLAIAASSLFAASPARAQVTAEFETQRAPQFLLATNARTTVALDVSRVPVLRQRLALDLQGVSVKAAIAQISRRAGVVIWYSDDVLRRDTPVHLRADNITVAAALTDVLMDAGVDVVFSRDGTASLVKRAAKAALPAVGTVAGRVIDSTTAEGLSGATVAVEGTRISTITGSDGRYTLRGIPTGTQRVTARRLGYSRGFQSVTVVENAESRADFVLARAPTMLSEMIATATGERERLEVGNAIGTIRADSIVPTTLIRNMSDLLQARTPGVIVTNVSGQVGSPSKVRVRGVNSMSLNNDPIIVLDGVRLASQTTIAPSQVNVGDARVTHSGFLGGGTPVTPQLAPSRLDDIDPNIIESIDILRGPSAASLYGTEAANGVIVIKTKRGTAGAWRTQFLADEGRMLPAGRFPEQWFGWGRTTLERGTTQLCMLAAPTSRNNVDAGTCVQDSVTHFHPQNHADMRTLGTGTSRNVSASVSGGTDQLREFLSFRVSDQVGMAKLSDAQQRLIAQLWKSPAPHWMVRPNAEKDFNSTSRTTLRFGQKGGLSLNASGIYRDVLNGGAGLTDFGGGLLGAYGPTDTLHYLPGETLRPKQTAVTKRGTVSANMDYVPIPWLMLRGTVGADYSLRAQEVLVRARDCTEFLELHWRGERCRGSRVTDRGETFVATVDVGATFTFNPLTWLNSRTSIGEQYSDTRFNALRAANGFNTDLGFGSDLLSPNPVPIGGTPQLFDVTESRDEAATAGWYLEQTAGIRERLFVTVSARQDAASAFGENVNKSAPFYPKASLSWLLSSESFFPRQSIVTAARLRTAYGHSGNQASQSTVLNNYRLDQAIVEGTTFNGIQIARMGNPDLRPERVREWEGGLDLSFLKNERIRAELTMYRKFSEDAIITATLPPSYGIGRFADFAGFVTTLTQSVNVGSVQNRGAEVSVNARVLDLEQLGWETTLNWSQNKNTLVKKDPRLSASGPEQTEFREGYPLYGYWGYPVVSYTDANGDGILGFSEMTFGNRVFMGAPYPKQEFTIANTATFLRGAFRVDAVVDRISGLANRYAGGTQGVSRGNVDPTVSLAMQAAAMQALMNGGFLNESSTWRFAELSGTYNIPPTLSKRLRVRSAAITLAGRNLGLWTDYAGKDPNVDTSGALGEATRDNGTGVPQPRQWTVRFNLGL